MDLEGNWAISEKGFSEVERRICFAEKVIMISGAHVIVAFDQRENELAATDVLRNGIRGEAPCKYQAS